MGQSLIVIDLRGLEGVGSFNNGGHAVAWAKGVRVPVLAPLDETLDILRQGGGEMVAKNFKGSDNFYHCVAMCNASSRGMLEGSFAATAGVVREMCQQYGKGDSAAEYAADNRANGQGIAAGISGQVLPCILF